jgi:hypothetical protein
MLFNIQFMKKRKKKKRGYKKRKGGYLWPSLMNKVEMDSPWCVLRMASASMFAMLITYLNIKIKFVTKGMRASERVERRESASKRASGEGERKRASGEEGERKRESGGREHKRAEGGERARASE